MSTAALMAAQPILTWLLLGPRGGKVEDGRRTSCILTNSARVDQLRARLTWLSPHMDFLLALARLGDVVGGLHMHERIHLHPEGLLDAERRFSGEAGLAV
jgi:hypothetical protein